MNLYLFRKIIRRLPGIVIKAVPLPNPKIIEGYGKRDSVGEICKENGYKSVLLITDKTLYSLGFQNSVIKSLEDNGITYSVFSNIETEPNVDIVIEGRTIAENCNAECIIALGGGSVLDSSKIISAAAKHRNLPIGYFMQKFVFAKTLPMITIPSTAGTGAEATVGAVVKNKKGVKKASVIVGLDVKTVILDSELTINAPKKVTLCCGIDALSHGLEGCLSDVKVKKEDMIKSQECVRLVLENLIDVADNPNNIDKRQKLCLSANYGGNAINKQLAGYVHAFAHTIGGFYHIPHGEAIAYCIVPVVSYYKEICSQKLVELSIYCGYSDENTDKQLAVEAFMEKLLDFIKKCGYSNGFDKLDKKDYKMLIKGIDSDSINYSPAKTLKDEEIAVILDEIKRGIS